MEGNINASRYIKKVLEPKMLPSAHDLFGANGRITGDSSTATPRTFLAYMLVGTQSSQCNVSGSN